MNAVPENASASRPQEPQTEAVRPLQVVAADKLPASPQKPKERALGERQKRAGGERKGAKTITRRVLENVAIVQTTDAPGKRNTGKVIELAGPEQKSKRSKKTASKPPKEVLASPERANIRFQQQSFEFCSSSQLVRELPLETNEPDRPFSHANKHEKDTRLWSAAARHEGERVTPTQTNNKSDTALDAQNDAMTLTETETAAYFNLPVTQKSRSRIRHGNQMSILQVIPSNVAPRAAYSLHTVAKKAKPRVDPSEKDFTKLIETIQQRETASLVESVPQQAGPSTEQVINTYSTPAMHTVLEKDKSSVAIASHASDIKIKTPTEFQHIDEINDSGSEGTPTDILSSSLPNSSPLEPQPPAPDGVSQKPSKATSTAAATSGQKAAIYRPVSAEEAAREAIIFPFITAAVRNQPHGSTSGRSDRQRHPTWWQKMLLYDPIVIEDLTSWINSGVLDDTRLKAELRIDEDESLRIPFRTIQRWCESNSVCCIWREGLGGGIKYQY